MKSNVTKPNKKVFRVILAASAVLILCGAFCGAAAAAELTKPLTANSIVEKVTLHDVDTSQGQKYSMKLTASSLLWDEFKLQVLAESDLYIKPFKLEVTCNEQPYNEAKLTIGFKVDKQKVEEYKAKIEGDVEVRLGHLKADRTWELLSVTKKSEDDKFLHYEVKEIKEPSSLFAIVVTKAPEKVQIEDKTATPTPTPAGKSPVPFMGVLAGLGCAAVLFGLRMRK